MNSYLKVDFTHALLWKIVISNTLIAVGVGGSGFILNYRCSSFIVSKLNNSIWLLLHF